MQLMPPSFSRTSSTLVDSKAEDTLPSQWCTVSTGKCTVPIMMLMHSSHTPSRTYTQRMTSCMTHTHSMMKERPFLCLTHITHIADCRYVVIYQAAISFTMICYLIVSIVWLSSAFEIYTVSPCVVHYGPDGGRDRANDGDVTIADANHMVIDQQQLSQCS